MDRPRFTRAATTASAIWVILVIVALATALHSISRDDFDGLNNMLQIPLALPWWLIVPAPWSHTVDAWVTAGLGLVNAGIVFVLVSRWETRRSAA